MGNNSTAAPEGNIPRMVRSHDIHLNSDYVAWIQDVKKRFRSARIKAAVKVNSEQLLFNWELGRDLVERKAEETWGRGIVEQVSLDLQNEFPGVQGFSTRNLWNMKKWYLFYSADEHREKLQQLVAELEKMPSIKTKQIGRPVESEKRQQVVAEYAFPPAFAFVPWGHHVEIVSKCETIEEAYFYIERTISEGWSRSALQNSLKADLYHKCGRAVTNLSRHLPSEQSQHCSYISTWSAHRRVSPKCDTSGWRHLALRVSAQDEHLCRAPGTAVAVLRLPGGHEDRS